MMVANKKQRIYQCAMIAVAASAVPAPALAEDRQEAGERRKADQASRKKLGKHDLEDVVVINGKRDGPYTAPSTVGSKIPLTSREIPNSVSVVTRQQIEDQNLGTLGEVLSTVAGVAVSPSDGILETYRARGFTMSTSFDGIPAYAGADNAQLDIAVYERVEVLRGPAGVLQGSDNPGGVINLVRKRGQDKFALSGAVTAARWNDYRGELDIGGPLNKSASIRARGVLSGQSQQFFYRPTKSRKWTGYSTIDWDIAHGTTVSLSYAKSGQTLNVPSQGLPSYLDGSMIPDLPRSLSTFARWSRYVWDTEAATVDLEQRIGDWTARARYASRDQSFFFKDGFPAQGLNPVTGLLTYSRRKTDIQYERDSVDLFVSGPVHLLGRSHELLFGYNFDRLRTNLRTVNAPQVTGIPFGHPELVPDFDLDYNYGRLTITKQSGFYGQARLKPLSWATVILGGRLSDFLSTNQNVAPAAPTAPAGARSKGQFTPYGGLILDVAKPVSVYASYADIFAPSSNPRFSGGVIDPRVGRQYEVGVKTSWFSDRLNVSAAVFNLRDTNRSYPDLAHTGFYLNLGKVEAKGWEVEASGSPARGVDLQASYTRTDTVYLVDRYQEGLEYETLQPRHSFKLWAVRRFDGGILQGLSIGAGGTAISRISANSSTGSIRTQPGGAVLNALVSYQIDRHVSLSLNLTNLLDRVYYARVGGFNTYTIYGEPRNVALTARAKL